jgi:hypothetical protein
MMLGEAGAVEAARDEQTGPQRVVLRAVTALVLDDMPPSLRSQVLEACDSRTDPSRRVFPRELWEAVASGSGTVESAVKSYAGQSGTAGAKPGTYKALPVASWRVPAMVIEPPLP